jgi:hypothetical protein
MPAELLKLVNAAVFEVVVEKPQTDSLVYDRCVIRDSGGPVYEVDQINAGSKIKNLTTNTKKD